jgi:hypothetical protein
MFASAYMQNGRCSDMNGEIAKWNTKDVEHTVRLFREVENPKKWIVGRDE